MKRLILLALALFIIPLASAQDDDLPVLAYGVPQTFDITGPDAVSFAIEGTAGDEIYMTQYSLGAETDAVMRLFSSRGALLGESVDVGDTQVIDAVTLPDDGRYVVSMQRPDFSEFTGTVSVLVDTVDAEDVTLPLIIENEEFGASGQVLRFSIPVTKNTLFSWSLACEQCGAALLPPSGDYNQMMTWGMSDYMEMRLMLLVEPGTYTFYIQNRAPDSVFSLWMDSPGPEPLTANEPITGTIENFETHAFSFNSAAGKVWQVSSNIADGNRQLQILRLDGRAWWDTVLAQDDGSGPNGNARIQSFIAPDDGTYYVLLRWQAWDDNTTPRDFELTLQPDTLRTLAPGTTFSGTITAETGNINYLYDGVAGEQVTITLERTSETGAPFIGFYSPFDEVTTVSGRNATRVQVTVVLPETARYEVILSNISYDQTGGMDYSILLESIPPSQ